MCIRDSYDSNTGFLFPELQTESRDERRTVERALKATWSSYWNFRAVEERRLEGIDHLAGAMAVLVHPRFDDDLEITNGVFTLTLQPNGPDRYVMDLNVQAGAESVTNPTPGLGATPEVVEVRSGADGDDAEITRVATSTLVDPDQQVLSDADVVELFARATEVADAWLDRINDTEDASGQRRTLTLDFEFRQMDGAWPALMDDEASDDRLVIKQVRSLDPAAPTLAEDVAIPTDILARASTVTRHTCTSDNGSLTALLVTTDPLLAPDQGFAENPMLAELAVDLNGQRHEWTWADLVDVATQTDGSLTATGPVSDGELTVSLDADGSYRLAGNGVGAGGSLTCSDTTLLTTPCLLYTSPSPRDATLSRMPSSA